MAWRSVMISKPSRLSLKDKALRVAQSEGTASVPLEDIATLVIENPEVSITSKLLSACAAHQVAVITVDEAHHPNGVLLAHLPHSRVGKILRAQMYLSRPKQKRLWQCIIKQKIRNQAMVLEGNGHERRAHRLFALANEVRSGDTGLAEAHASQAYFPALFGKRFTRGQERFHNAALNYGYSIVRSVIARSLVSYGFLTALGLHHHNEQNAFNLADDLIEPFRPLLDDYVLEQFSAEEEPETGLRPEHKSKLVGFLHEDITVLTSSGEHERSTLLAAVNEVVSSLSRALRQGETVLSLPMCSRNGGHEQRN